MKDRGLDVEGRGFYRVGPEHDFDGSKDFYGKFECLGGNGLLIGL